MPPEAIAADYKKKVVNELVNLIKEYPIIGAVDMENLPAPQLQAMRKQLRGSVVIRMAKKRLIRIAIENCKDKKGIEKIEPYLKGMPALLFTNTNPFKLYKTLQKSKSSAPAKAGQAAPNDIVIPKGPTSFAPGPIIGELGALGIKTSVEGGKIAVTEDTVVVKEGEVINEKLAGLLSRFGIEPMEIGLNLVAVYEDGTIYTKDILDVDEEEFMNKLTNAHKWAFNLAVEAGHYTKETVEVMIPKAFNEAKAAAKEGKIMCDLLAEELVEQAEREALNLKSEGNISTEAKEEKKEVKEKKEEAKPEVAKEEQKEEKTEVREEKEVKEAEKKEAKQEVAKEEQKEEKTEVKEEKEEAKQEVQEEKKEEEKVPEAKPEVQEKKEKVQPEQEVKEAEKKEEVQPEQEVKEAEKKEEEKKEAKPEVQEKKEKVQPEQEVKEAEKKEEEKVPEPKPEAQEEKKEAKKEVKEEDNVPEEPDPAELLKKAQEKAAEMNKKEESKKEAEESSRLFEELKKKGNLRDNEKKEMQEKEAKTGKLEPHEIIEKAMKDKNKQN